MDLSRKPFLQKTSMVDFRQDFRYTHAIRSFEKKDFEDKVNIKMANTILYYFQIYTCHHITSRKI